MKKPLTLASLIDKLRIKNQIELRKAPSPESPVAAVLKPGEVVEVVYLREKHYFVRGPNARNGWTPVSSLPSITAAVKKFFAPPPDSIITPGANQTLLAAVSKIDGDQGHITEEFSRKLDDASSRFDLLIGPAFEYLQGLAGGDARFHRAIEFLHHLNPPLPRPRNWRYASGEFGSRDPDGPIPEPGDDLVFSMPGFRSNCFLNFRSIEGVVLALVNSAFSQRPSKGDPRHDAIWKDLWQVDQLMGDLVPFEFMYELSLDMQAGKQAARDQLKRCIKIVLGKENRRPIDVGNREGSSGNQGRRKKTIGLDFPNMFPDFEDPGLLLGFDFCRLMRGEMLADALSRCFCDDRYRIDRIVQVDSIPGPFCAEDIIVIGGEGFGQEVVDGLITGNRPVWDDLSTKNLVAFRGRDDTSVSLFDDRDYVEWRDDQITVRIPREVPGPFGAVELLVKCVGHNVLRTESCGTARKMPDLTAPDAERRRTYHMAGILEIADVRARRIDEGSGCIVPCEGFDLVMTVNNATQLTVTGEGAPADSLPVTYGTGVEVTVRISPGNIIDANLSYTISASNRCPPAGTPLTHAVEFCYPLRFEREMREITGPLIIPATTDSIPLDLVLPCPAPAPVTVNLDLSTDAIRVSPNPVVFEADSQRQSIRIEILRLGTCRLEATAVEEPGLPPYEVAGIRMTVEPTLGRFTHPLTHRQYLNGNISIAEEGLSRGPVQLVYTGLRASGEAIDTGAFCDGSEIQSQVPDDAIDGFLRARTADGTVDSDPSDDSLTILPPIILGTEPLILARTFSLSGNGFSNTPDDDDIKNTVNFYARAGASARDRILDAPGDLAGENLLGLTMPDAAPYRGLIEVLVDRPDRYNLISNRLRYQRQRVADPAFVALNFRAGVEIHDCPTTGTLRSTPIGATEFGGSLMRTDGSVVGSETFFVHDGIGGLSFSPSCEYIVVLSASEIEGSLHPFGVRFLLTSDLTRRVHYQGELGLVPPPDSHLTTSCVLMSTDSTIALIQWDFVDPAHIRGEDPPPVQVHYYFFDFAENRIIPMTDPLTPLRDFIQASDVTIVDNVIRYPEPLSGGPVPKMVRVYPD